MTSTKILARWIVISTASCWLNVSLLTVPARAHLIASDAFNYGPLGSDLNGNGDGGSFGFSNAWTGQTSYNIGHGSLTSPVNPLPLVGNSVTAVAFGDNRGVDRTLSTPLGTEGTSTYVSILMQPQGILHQGAFNGWFGLALRGSTDVVIGMSSFGDTYGVEIGFGNSRTTTNAIVGTAVFLVLRIDFTEGVDPAYLYVNPQPGTPEPATPSASLVNLNVNSLNVVSLTGPGASGFDSLRIGTSFADVAPATADFQENGSVRAMDLPLWKAGFGLSGVATHMQGDADFDLDVDGADFLLWQRQLGFHLPGLSATVPEPGSWALLCLFAMSWSAAGGYRRATRPTSCRG